MSWTTVQCLRRSIAMNEQLEPEADGREMRRPRSQLIGLRAAQPAR